MSRPPLKSLREKFWKEWGKEGRERKKEAQREKRGKEKRENGEEKKVDCKWGEGKLKMEGERYENEQRLFLFFVFSYHFLKPLKFV